jgi:hypothetical protein
LYDISVQLLGVRQAARGDRRRRPVKRRPLVRVLAVPQHRRAVPFGPDPGREPGVVVGRGEHVAHPGGHRDVVAGGVREGVRGQPPALGQGEPAGRHRGQQLGVAARVDDDGHARVVLRRRAHHRRATDVDLLHARVRRGPRHHGLQERVEVHHHQVERFDPELGQLPGVGRQPAVGEDAGMHPRVQGLHPTVEALREAGELLDLGDRDPGRGDPGRGGTGGDQLDAGSVQAGGELLQAGLVVHRDQRTPHRAAGFVGGPRAGGRARIWAGVWAGIGGGVSHGHRG